MRGVWSGGHELGHGGKKGEESLRGPEAVPEGGVGKKIKRSSMTIIRDYQ